MVTVILRDGCNKTGLEDLIQDIKNKIGDSLTMIELGSYTGESAQIFSDSKVFKKIYCIDFWTGGYCVNDLASDNMPGAEEAFDIRFKNNNTIVKIKANAKEGISQIKGMVDLIYIDAAHEYSAVLDDIKTLLPLLTPGKIICGHDYTSWPGVRQAVDEVFGKPDKIYNDSSWIKFL